ncbi:MAG: hypothetical protein HZC02_02175 [Candidatus Levybacteria bacterium]|nr:hypothetical protein [Candidatus Levybacteria bacterium]
MWSRKRLLKKEKRHHNKKKILLLSLFFGLIGVFFIAVGALILSREPIFTSPLPLLRTFGASTDKNEDKAAIESFLSKNHITYKKLEQVGSSDFRLQTQLGVVFLTSNRDLSVQLTSLQRILSRLTMEGKKFVRLDLRFDKPVIVLQ